MTPKERLGLLVFGLVSWSSAMFTAHGTDVALVADVAVVQAGLSALCFATALLPGRMARFT